ncbi:hypothetical protein [Streptomyces sp. NPDC000410]|uniref:hypothetical protein n=1 Tax=Streptomyces sp. NPDC000410 TaxID=3154254 RepID=UPI00332B6B4A
MTAYNIGDRVLFNDDRNSAAAVVTLDVGGRRQSEGVIQGCHTDDDGTVRYTIDASTDAGRDRCVIAESDIIGTA